MASEAFEEAEVSLGDERDDGLAGPESGLVRNYELPATVERQAILTPINRDNVHTFSGAIYSEAAKLVPHSQRLVGRARKPENPSLLEGPTPTRRLEGRSLFAGILFRNFGHFLLESTSRLWALASLDYRPERLVYHAFTPDAAEQLKNTSSDGYISSLLRAVGYRPEDIDVVVDEPAILDEVVVPQSTVALNGYVHPRFVDFFDRVVESLDLSNAQTGTDSRRIYLSRSLLKGKKRHAENEREIEQVAVNAGFEVVHPQRIPFREQVALMQGAEVVSGCDGSAMHLTVFARPGTRVLCFDARRGTTQRTIEAVRGLQGICIKARAETHPGKWKRLHAWTADLEVVRQAFSKVG